MQTAALELAPVLEDVVRVVRRISTVGDLGVSAAAVLSRLHREGPQRLTALAAAEGLSQPGTTQLVTRLERDGLLQRTRADDDGRVVLVEITGYGADIVARRRRERAEALDRLLARLDAADRDAVRTALPALSRLTRLALDQEGPA